MRNGDFFGRHLDDETDIFKLLFVVKNEKDEEKGKARLDFSLVMTEKTLADQEAEKQTQIGADPPEAQSSATEVSIAPARFFTRHFYFFQRLTSC